MSGIFPNLSDGAVIVRDIDGNSVTPPGVTVSGVYRPAEDFIMTCPETAHPDAFCFPRVTAEEINAIKSEMIAFAEAMNPTGTWACGNLTNLAANFEALIVNLATIQYVNGIVAAQDAMVFKGVVDCSANPNYPAADRGHTYRVSVAGKIGGASGPNVEAGDILMCLTDSTSSGNHATVGSAWAIIQANLDGALLTTAIGSTVQAYNTLLTAIAALSANGLVARTASGASAARTITAGTGATVSNGDGVSGNPTVGPDLASAAQYQAATANKVLAADATWTAAAPVTLADGATITPDFGAGINFVVTLGGNRTLANPTNVKPGQAGIILVKQDGTGSRTLTWGSHFKWPSATAPTLSTTASRVDKIFYWAETSSIIHMSCEKDSR